MIQDSLKVENTPKHYRKEHNVSGTTQSPFLTKFKVTSKKFDPRKDTHHSVAKT